MGRRRLNLSMSEELYDTLTRIAGDYKFRNACEMSTALLAMFARKVLHAEETNRNDEDADEMEIDRMFVEFADWEPTPEAGHAPKVRRPRRK